ncbi:metallopeptidase family protein [soil metagenome]
MTDKQGPSARPGHRRDRRGRGLRGPWVLPGRHSPDGVPRSVPRSSQFDAVVTEMVGRLERRWPDELAQVEFGVEETPWLDDDWHPDQVPLATLARARAGSPTRIVVYRWPVRRRAGGPQEERRLVLDALVEQVAELLGRSPEEIDPRISEE